MTEIAKKKFEILEYTQSDNFTIDGLADKLNELTNLALVVNKNDLLPTTLMRIHPELTYSEAESLMEFAKSKTITHEECYGDGSIIYPMWKEANYR